MCASTTPVVAEAGPNSRPESRTPSLDAKLTPRESPTAVAVTSFVWHATSSRSVAASGARRRVGRTARDLLLAQLHALVSRSLQKLLGLLLPHLLAALLDQRRHVTRAFPYSVPK